MWVSNFTFQKRLKVFFFFVFFKWNLFIFSTIVSERRAEKCEPLAASIKITSLMFVRPSG